MHHKTPVSEGGADEMENLVTVCIECHKELHGRAPVPLERILKGVEQCESSRLSTQDVADHAGCAYNTAYKKLRKLAEKGEIATWKDGNRRFWGMPSE